MSSKISAEVRGSAWKGVKSGFALSALGFVGWLFSILLGRAQGVSSWSGAAVVGGLFISQPVLWGFGNAAVVLLNHLADRGTVGQILTGVIVGATVAVFEFIMLPILGDRIDTVGAAFFAVFCLGCGFLGGVGLAISRALRRR